VHAFRSLRRWASAVVVGCLLVVWPAPALATGTAAAAAEPRLPAPASWPLAGTPRVTRGFDPPASVYGPGHRGVDLAARPGDPVLAAAAGTVTFAGSVAGRGVVTVDHGQVSTTYEPVRALVRAGQRVSLGQPIGAVGHGGHCDGHCLHWGLRQGAAYLDPLLLLSGGSGALRLVPMARRAVVEREALARAAARAPTETALAPGRPGSHGFLHPVPGGITSPYGMRFHPILKVWKLHDGTDFGAACGTAIRAAYGGRVGRRYFNAGYGNRLFIDHGTVDGVRVTTAYNHATRYVVRPGEHVRRGQVIGYVGRTGLATGCHLHLMVWLNGRMVNPMSWL
jgi:murein DD-endopeptidase MepM/ murein hydrolase activator NlpD